MPIVPISFALLAWGERLISRPAVETTRDCALAVGEQSKGCGC
jgi:hypothetical protein